MKQNKKILMFVHTLYEEMELHYPRYRLIEEGIEVVVAGPRKQEIYAGKHGYPCEADEAIANIHHSHFDGLVIPGGYAPDKLRIIPEVLKITQQMHHEGKLIAFICHAGWIPASAGILKGVKCTSYKAIKDDLIHAGAQWVDAPVVTDKNLISSRHPNDLPVFCHAILEFLGTAHVTK
ncbi:MAG TPA: type 1 glutamine amidotransferase domain-containing protein [Waddliaceae bacterium]